MINAQVNYMRNFVFVLIANSETQDSKLNKYSDNLTFNCRPFTMS